MNEQSSKKILYNKSTLFNLKAELLKKQEEVFDKKQLPQNKLENYKPPVSKPNKEKSTENSKRSFKDSLKAVDVEELEACRKAKAALEKKAELYEHLTDGAGSSVLADRFLVDFKTKKEEEVREVLKQHESDDDDMQEVDDAGPDGWTEFTDCLGRTRKCHKSDLEMFKKRDVELRKATFKEQESSVVDETPEIQEEKKEPTLLVQKTNDYLQSLRDKWEEKERQMMGKDRDIHYQDLLFDEARIHGVGYYSFSTDEKERRKQMDELIKTREQTVKAQKQAEEVRKKREEVMAARVKAARARQRARAGLPPEEPEDDRESFTAKLLEFLTTQRDEAESKAKEEEKKQKEELERERQKLREAYIREWDLGKDGVEGKVNKFREMTQEEYVAQQRDKRIDEFAPFQTASTSMSNYTFDNSGSMVGDDSIPAKTWLDVRPKVKTPLPDMSNIDEQKGLYFSTKKQKDETEATITGYDISKPKTPPPIKGIVKKDVKYKNFVRSEEPEEVTPIVNELSDDEGDNEDRGNYKRPTDGIEIAPPPTYDYYGPIPKKVKYQKPFQSDIREAYAQGAKSLEAKSSNIHISKDYDFTFG